MYLVFAGLTADFSALSSYLENVNHTILTGTSRWNGLNLNAQVIIMFDKDDALALRDFLKNDLHQLEVPVHFINSTVI